MGVIVTNGLILAIGVVILIILGVTQDDQGFKDCHELCQHGPFDNYDQALSKQTQLLARNGTMKDPRDCATEQWILSPDSNECQALAYGQSDEWKDQELANFVIGCLWLITCIMAMGGACCFMNSLVKVQIGFLPLSILTALVIGGTRAKKMDDWEQNEATGFFAVGIIINILVNGGIMLADIAFVSAGITKDNYEADHKHCCSVRKQEAAPANAPAVVEATVVEATVVEATLANDTTV